MGIHHTYGRGMALTRESFGIYVSQNVFYDVAGNNIHVMGMFSSAFLMENVLVNPKRSYRMYQADLVPAAIKLDGVMNIVLKNRVGGGPCNGIWG